MTGRRLIVPDFPPARKAPLWLFLVRKAAGVAGKWPRSRRQRSTALLEQSPLFDRDWYVRKYPDVGSEGIDPARHYIEFGWREGRDPSPLFSTNAYLRANPDVARSGANPLLHFLEYGYSEGRGTSKHRAVVLRAASPGEPFGDAAPCYSAALVPDSPFRWRRASRLDLTSDGLLIVADLPVGNVSDAQLRTDIEGVFARLRQLSGYEDSAPCPAAAKRLPSSAHALLDAWYIDQGRLRTRWTSDGAIVVRAYQHDPLREGQLRMVAEGLWAGPIDFVDVSLHNRYFPVLFIISEPDGTVLASDLLAFPSLCRGGVHYPEILALSRAQDARAIDLTGHCLALANRLLATLDENVVPMVSSIAVNLQGADGTQPLFEPEFRTWLARVMRIGVNADEQVQQSPNEFLASAVELRTDGTRTHGGKLVLGGDMVPTISLLSTPATTIGQPLHEMPLSLVVAGSEPSQPATLFELPKANAAVLQASGAEYASPWPWFSPEENGYAADQIPLAAIRLPLWRELTDAELLVPVSGRELPLHSAPQPITWLVRPEGWRHDTLAQTLASLAIQIGAERHVVALVGKTDPAVVQLARRLFGNRIRECRDVEEALSGAETQLFGHVGRGVILHERRCSEVLCAVLVDPAVATASCPIVHAEPRGKGWHVEIVDAGSLMNRDGPTAIPLCDAQRLWRSSYLVARPPRDFWVARAAHLASSIHCDGSLRPQEGLHVCTSLITASVEKSERSEPIIALSDSPAAYEVRSEALFG